MTKQGAQEITHALMVVKDARDAAVQERHEDLMDALNELEESLSRLGPARGISVARAAQWLGVSEPTVREWVRRGPLERIEGQTPVQIDADRLQQISRAITELRRRGQDRDWLRALAAYMEDESAKRGSALREGLEQLRNGKLEPA